VVKIVLASRDEGLLSELRGAFPSVDFRLAPTIDDQRREIVDADALYGLPSREAFRAARQLRWIHCPGTGIDAISAVPELVDSDVPLTNARGPHVEPMADHVFAQLLALVHHVPRLWEDQRAHRWDTRAYDSRIVGLHGKSMGIVALGDVGMAVARRARGFGLRVRGIDVRPIEKPDWIDAIAGPEGLDEMLGAVDIVVVAAPLTRPTRGLLDRRRLGLMKAGAYLIVVSRGGIVDEAALVDALRSDRLAGAGIDVTAVEPLPGDSPLWDAPNLLISPHVSALTPEMWAGRREIFVENLRRFLANEPFLYVCDKEAGY
jgi:phosphoglycerate dehydrogenase-like enzyme